MGPAVVRIGVDLAREPDVSVVIWATTLGTGKARCSAPWRRKARDAKSEANAKFWAVGSERRVGRFLHLRRYGDAILAVYEMNGIPAPPPKPDTGADMLRWMQKMAGEIGGRNG